MSNILNFKNWVRVNEEATTSTKVVTNQLATPNYWFSKMEKLTSTSDITFKFSYKEKTKAYNALEKTTGTADRDRQLIEISIPLNGGVKDYQMLDKYLRDGGFEWNKNAALKFDIKKTTEQLMNPAYFGIRNGSGPLAKMTVPVVINHFESIPAFGYTTNKQFYGVEYGDAKNIWDLMLYMMTEAGLGK